MSKGKKDKSFFSKLKGWGQMKVDNIEKVIGDLGEQIEEVVKNTVIKVKRPETEDPIKNVVAEIGNMIKKLQKELNYDEKSPDLAAGIQMQGKLINALLNLDKSLAKINMQNNPLKIKEQWDTAVLAFNNECSAVIKEYHKPMIEASSFWNSVKSVLNSAIDCINKALDLDESNKIQPFVLDETKLSLKSTNLKGQLNKLKEDMVDNEPSIQPKP